MKVADKTGKRNVNIIHQIYAIIYFKIHRNKNTEQEKIMTPLDIMKQPAAYANGYEKMPFEAQNHAKQLCWEYN